MKITFSGGSQARLAHSVQPTGVRRSGHTIGPRIQRAVATFLTYLCALFLAGVTSLITAAFVVSSVCLPLSLAGGLYGACIGAATLTVGAVSLLTLSLLTGLTLGTEAYISMAFPEDQWNGPMPCWLRALWAAAAGALVGALPCAMGVDWLLLGPARVLPGAGALATHLVSLGALTGAMSGITMERFRIWRRPSPDRGVLASQLACPPPRKADAAQVRADPQPVLPVDQEAVNARG